jgi:hypothetical protein
MLPGMVPSRRGEREEALSAVPRPSDRGERFYEQVTGKPWLRLFTERSQNIHS